MFLSIYEHQLAPAKAKAERMIESGTPSTMLLARNSASLVEGNIKLAIIYGTRFQDPVLG